jgi:RNA polymerase sigma-70 factor (ECF subfamily)
MKGLPEEIITLLNKKNDAAFEVVFNIFYPRLVAFAKQYVADEEAFNHVQDAFVTLLDKNLSFLNENQLQSYLYTSVKNNCLMFLRHEQVKKKYSESRIADHSQIELNIQALERLNTSLIAFSEIEQIINLTLNELPPRCREVFILSRFEGKKNIEVADLLSISEKAVEAHISKALRAFRISLKDYLNLFIFWF